jgi:hypothetical protein
MFFTRNANGIHFNYYIGYVLLLRSDPINDLGVPLDSKLYFHCYVDFVSHSLRILGLIRYITYISSFDSLVVL